ncbi:hypothetical protein ACS0TY_022003 [Phlomoides rotata]
MREDLSENLPPIILEMLGEVKRSSRSKLGTLGWCCLYRYYVVEVGCDGWSRLSHGWCRLMGTINIQQGDTLYFERDVEDNLKFHVSVDKHEGAIKIEEE